MKVAHLSDLHLGFSAYPRHERGRNVREADVASAFLRAVEEIVRIRPDVVLVAGDVFDRPDPPSAALVTFARGVETLRGALPHTPVLIAAGPRDTPCRGSDPGVLAALDTVPGVEAAATEPRIVRVRDELAVHLLPHRAALGESAGALSVAAPPSADPSARWNVLVTHARAPRRAGEGAATAVDPRRWDYVALGGEHAQRALHPHVRWPGSLERVGWRPWEEALEEKGFVTYDLAERRAEFHPLPVRGVVSLAPLRVAPGDPDRVRRRVREVTDELPGGIEGKIVLVRVQGAEPSDLDGVKEDLLPALRNRALHVSVVLDDTPLARPPRPPAPPLDPRLADLLEEEGVPRATARARAAALTGEPRTEVGVP